MSKTGDEIENDGDEPDEITRIENALKGNQFDEATIRRLIQENPDGATDAILAFVKSRDDATTTLLGRQRRQDLETYKKGLAEEFPYADPDLITGSSKKEMRRSAEKVHKGVERILTAAGVKPGEKKADPPVEKKDDGRAAAWGTPPAGATEVVREAPGMATEQVRAAALNVKGPNADQQYRDVVRSVAESGPRIITRPSLATALAGRARKED